MDPKLMEKIAKGRQKKRPDVKVGDTIKLHMKIKEGDKERVQIFEGVVISMKGSGLNKTVTARKVSYGIGVERIFPMYADTLEKIEVVKRGTVKKSKLYFMKRRVGKRALKVGGVKDVYMTDEIEVPVTGTEEVVDEQVETTESAPAETPAPEKAQVEKSKEE
jgi:large subunit ribosomal protein L19